VWIAGLPGVRLEGDIEGKRGFDLLSTKALIEIIGENADRLMLRDVQAWEMPLKLDDCFESGRQEVREAAEDVARRYGHRIGYLLATLKRGDTVNRRARPEWDDSYWQHWAGIRRVYLGGGLVSGRMAPKAIGYARGVVAEAGVSDCEIYLSEYPSQLPLIGAARSGPQGVGMMAVFDFGSSFTKSALASYENGTLVALSVLPRKATSPGQEGGSVETQAVGLANFMVRTMAETWLSAYHSGSELGQEIIATVASYLINGQPDATQAGKYGELRHVSPDIGGWFSDEVSSCVGQDIRVRLLHDGTAAAMTYAGPEARETAVITLGTALGVGYPTWGEGQRPIERPLKVEII
jgi:hypothetical protein